MAINNEEYNTNKFSVWTVDDTQEEYTHWSNGITTYIKKDGVTIKLTGKEVQEIINTLPRTFGGTYKKDFEI